MLMAHPFLGLRVIKLINAKSRCFKMCTHLFIFFKMAELKIWQLYMGYMFTIIIISYINICRD